MVPQISVQAAHERLAGEFAPRLIDVREADEWEICRIPGAELLPLSGWPEIALERLLDREAELIIQCHHGGRSERAAGWLMANGFNNVKNLAGGIDGWALEVDPSIRRY